MKVGPMSSFVSLDSTADAAAEAGICGVGVEGGRRELDESKVGVDEAITSKQRPCAPVADGGTRYLMMAAAASLNAFALSVGSDVDEREEVGKVAAATECHQVPSRCPYLRP